MGIFLAPTGALGVTIYVRLSVRPVTSCPEQSIFIFLAQIFKPESRQSEPLNTESCWIPCPVTRLGRREKGGCEVNGVKLLSLVIVTRLKR